jgi:nucleoside-diphosphate-sugar epimerase
VLELLADSSEQVLCLVRPGSERTAETRLRRSLRDAAEAYDRRDLLPEIDNRCHALSGDLAEAGGGVARLPDVRIDTFWHTAASLNFHPGARDRTAQHNVAGTAAALEIARTLGARHFVHVSTAYVAGRRTGTILEEPVSDPDNVNNPYEETKARAELLVSAERAFRTWIVRPAIVIGHSRTFATLSSAGLYGAIAGAVEYKRAGIAKVIERPLHLVRSPDAPVNFIPVDAVARNARLIRQSGSDAAVFHLTNATPPTLEEVTRVICDAVGNPMPVFVDSDEGLTAIERAVQDHPDYRFQQPYLSSHRHFDLSNTNAAIGADASRAPLDGGRLRPYVDWYLEHADL